MYNDKIKQRFIEQYANTENMAKICQYTFDVSERSEAKFNKDIYEMDESEISRVVEEIYGIRSNSKYQKIAIMKSYIKWCANNSIGNTSDAIFSIKLSGVDKYRTRMVSSPKHLASILDCMCAPVDYDTTDIMIRVFCWLLYAGFSEEDARNVKEKDVDFKHASIRYGVRDVQLFRESISAFEKAIDLRKIAHYADSSPENRSYIDRVDGDCILRGIYKVPVVQSFRNEISIRGKGRGNGKIDDKKMQLSAQRIWLSGLFYRTYENEQVGICPDFMPAAIEYMSGREYAATTSNRTTAVRIARGYMNDYQIWKFAFNYF